VGVLMHTAHTHTHTSSFVHLNETTFIECCRPGWLNPSANMSTFRNRGKELSHIGIHTVSHIEETVYCA